MVVLWLGVVSPTHAQPAPVTPPALAPAPPAATPRPLIVSVHDLPPMIIKGPTGEWSGIAVEMWMRVALATNTPYTFKEYSLDEINHPNKTDIDVVLGFAISKFSEEVTDVSAPYFTSGLAIATRAEARSGLRTIADKVLSWSFVRGLLVLALAVVLVGTAVWRLEHKHSPDEYGGPPARGILGGVFWTIEALFGKGKSLSRTPASRVFAVLWAAVCIVLISGLTAKLSSELTVNRLVSVINGPADLPKAHVGAIQPSVGATYLERRSIGFRAYPDTAALTAALARGEIDAAVSSSPGLQYRINKSYADNLVVLPGTFQNIGVGFGLRIGSPLLRPINLALLGIAESQEWQQVLITYLGSS